MTRPKHWPHSNVGVEAVGESFRREALQAIAGNSPSKPALAYFTAELVPELNNPHDPIAVAVRSGEKDVAYLSRDDAVAYRANVGDAVTTADAIIFAGFSDGTKDFDYSVELLLAFDTPPDPKSRRKPRYEGVVTTDPTMRVSVSAEDGRITVVVPHVPTRAAAACWVGAPLVAWTKEDMADVHFFAPGFVGGTGRIAALFSKRTLEDLGAEPNHLSARVCFAGRNGVVFEVVPRNISALTPRANASAGKPRAAESIAWKLGRQVGRILGR